MDLKSVFIDKELFSFFCHDISPHIRKPYSTHLIRYGDRDPVIETVQADPVLIILIVKQIDDHLLSIRIDDPVFL